jgi:hypothetical protein
MSGRFGTQGISDSSEQRRSLQSDKIKFNSQFKNVKFEQKHDSNHDEDDEGSEAEGTIMHHGTQGADD